MPSPLSVNGYEPFREPAEMLRLPASPISEWVLDYRRLHVYRTVSGLVAGRRRKMKHLHYSSAEAESWLEMREPR